MTMRRLSLKSSTSNKREGRESLLMNQEPSGRTSKHLYTRQGSTSGSSSGGSDPLVEMAAKSGRLTPQHRFLPQHNGTPAKKEIPPEDGVLQFVPAFESGVDTSWDALYEGSTFPQSSMGFRKAQTTVGAGVAPRVSRRPSDAESSVSKSRSTGPRIARLASLFSGSGSTKPTSATTHNKKHNSPHNTTDPTLPSSPSRSSSSSGYVGWPGTQDKQGKTVAIQSSYEESDYQSSNNTNDPPSRHNSLPFGDELAYQEHERQRREMQEWMQSPPFQDISGVMADPDVSGMTMPEPPGEKADDSFYFAPAESAAEQRLGHSKAASLPMNQLFSNAPGWDDSHTGHSSPSRSSFSKNSSAYFDNDVRPMAFPAFEEGEKRRQAAAGVMRGMTTTRTSTPQPPTEESLALNNSYSPPPRTFGAEASRGYRGLLDKTHDVPNLMDVMESDSASSNVPSSATSGPYNNNLGQQARPSTLMPRLREEDYMTKRDSAESDVFDEISKYSIGDSEPFEGISTSVDSKQSQSMYEIRDANPFEGISQSVVEESKASLYELRNTTSSVEKRYNNQNSNMINNNDRTNKASTANVKVVLLGGGLTTIQTTNADFTNRISASDFDECLTNSDIDEYGHTRLPSFQEMAAAGRSPNDNASVVEMSVSTNNDRSMSRENKSFESFEAPGRHADSLLAHTAANHSNTTQDHGDMPTGRDQSFTAFETENHPHSHRSIAASDHGYKDDESAFFSDFYSADEVGFNGDLSEYYVQPSMVKKLVGKYRKLCRITMSNCRTYDDLDRAEDEKKVFALFEMRSRIMEKDIERGLERRGGTSVVDDLVTTPTNQRAMRIRDAVIVSKAWRDGATPIDVINTARLTQRDQRSYFILRPVNRMTAGGRRDNKLPRYRWEEVLWTDDTDFMQYCCPSLGARHLRGTEMYTIGDCQSILLKLTNEACIELRAQLNDATARQIEAEELMREEGDYGDGMMTESEMIYLSAMEEVKTISRQLVVAEKAFALVRDRIRNLVAKYESLLVKIDNEDMASSVITAESSCYSDEYGEELAWERRQQRAEVSAELAAREALLAKQSEERAVEEEKHRELRELQTRLAELQSEPSTTTTDRQRSVVLAKAIAARKQSSKVRNIQPTQTTNSQSTNVEDVKQRFRDRMAARMRQQKTSNASNHDDFADHDTIQQHPGNRYYTMQEEVPRKPVNLERQKLIRLAGEEMYQHLDFYERSLKAVETSRDGAF